MRPAFHFWACAYCEISQRRLPGFDAHVIRLYARGMSVREIRGHGLKLYGWEGWPDLISTITDEVLAEVEQCRRARLRRCIPLWISMRCGFRFGMKGACKTRPCILALWIRADGCREVLGLWAEQTAGAKFWLKVFNDAQ